MLKRLIYIMFLIYPLIMFSQENTSDEKVSAVVDNKPVLAVFTDVFDIKSLSFNKRNDPKGRGDELQVEFQLYNNTDLKRNLYIFVVATYEEEIWARNSILGTKIIPIRSDIKFIETYPSDNDNFKYEENGNTFYDKYPKDYKLGINPFESKPYFLDEDLIVRTSIISKYRKHYLFFNHVTLIIYGDEGELMYRQVYRIDGYRK